jgi:hypothetical protein
MVKALKPGYVAPAAVKAPSRNPLPRGIVAAPAKPPKPSFGAPGISASAAKHGKPAAKLPVASYGQQPKYIPTAYYGGTGGYVGQRR